MRTDLLAKIVLIFRLDSPAAWVPGRFDEVVVSTLPGASARRREMDFPHPGGRHGDVTGSHGVAKAAGRFAHRTGPPPQHQPEPLGPLAPMAWAGPKR